MSAEFGPRSRPGWRPELLRRHRERYGMSLEKACRQLHETARRKGLPVPGLTPSMMWKHETGKVYPGQHYQDLYCAMYGATEADLGFRNSLPGESASLADAQEVVAWTATIDHTQIQEKMAMALQRAIRFSALAGAAPGPEILAQLRDQMCRIAALYQTQPVMALIGDLVELQDVTFTLIDQNRRPAQLRDLYLVACVVSGLLAEANEDLGNFHNSRIHARTALTCAENTGHDSLRSWAMFQQMSTAYWAGAYQEAIGFAQAATELAERVAGTGAARLHAMSARAWAAEGNTNAALVALARADAARERAIADELDQIGGHVAYPLPRQLYHCADAVLWLPGEAERAERMSRDAIVAYESAPSDQRSYIPEAACRVDLAISRILQGELEGASEALAPVFELGPAQRPHNVRTALSRAAGLLRTEYLAGSAAARNCVLEIEDFTQYSSRTGL